MINVLGAVSGRADGVGDVDPALAGDPGDEVGPDAAHAARLLLEAGARRLAVGGAGRGAVEPAHAGAAAGARAGGAARGVADAGRQRRHHLPAPRHRALRRRRRR